MRCTVPMADNTALNTYQFANWLDRMLIVVTTKHKENGRKPMEVMGCL